MTRRLAYGRAIREGFAQLLARDPQLVVIGQGVWSPWYVGSSMTDLDKEFGRDRILDCPVSENAVTGLAAGAAMAGLRVVVVHPRMDFAVLGMDPLVNQAANWSYLFSGRVSVPMMLRAIINRGGEQGAQHSQALQAWVAHVPGLKVVMPATPADAKALLVAAVEDPAPVVYIDDRWLYDWEDAVPETIEAAVIGECAVLRPGADATVVAISYLVREALMAAELLAAEGLRLEVVDLRSLRPWDTDGVCASVRRTGRLVVADSAWLGGGFSAEVATTVAGRCHGALRAPVLRVGLPDCPAPTASGLEAAYYPRASTIVAAVRCLVQGRDAGPLPQMTHLLPGAIRW